MVQMQGYWQEGFRDWDGEVQQKGGTRCAPRRLEKSRAGSLLRDAVNCLSMDTTQAELNDKQTTYGGIRSLQLLV
jgi:hypothetical protein